MLNRENVFVEHLTYSVDIFMFLLQEIVHNKGVCYMYLKDSEKVCKLFYIEFTNH